MPTVTPFLSFDTQAEEAMNFYASMFKHAEVISVNRAQGRVISVEFELEASASLRSTPAPTSVQRGDVSSSGVRRRRRSTTAADKLTADGGAPGRCGWLKDKFGLSWRIVPRKMGELLGGGGNQRARRPRGPGDAADGQA